MRPLDQDAQLRTAAGAHHQRCRGRESERTGARDNQRRDRGSESHPCTRADEQPYGERSKRQPDHHWNEDCGNTIRQALHFGFAGLCLLDETPHLGKLGIRPNAGRPNHETATRIQRCAHYGVAGADLNGNGLAGEHACIYCRVAFGDLAVGRDLLARAHDEQIADDERCG